MQCTLSPAALEMALGAVQIRLLGLARAPSIQKTILRYGWVIITGSTLTLALALALTLTLVPTYFWHLLKHGALQ